LELGRGAGYHLNLSHSCHTGPCTSLSSPWRPSACHGLSGSRTMSALGHKQTSAIPSLMSALHPEADIVAGGAFCENRYEHPRYVSRQKASSYRTIPDYFTETIWGWWGLAFNPHYPSCTRVGAARAVVALGACWGGSPSCRRCQGLARGRRSHSSKEKAPPKRGQSQLEILSAFCE